MLGDIYVTIKNGKIRKVKETNKNAILLQWDGEYYNYFGKSKDYTYEGVVYDCFPIINIDEKLKEVVSCEMFGCEKIHGQGHDALLWDIPVDFDFWDDIKIFKDFIK